MSPDSPKEFILEENLLHWRRHPGHGGGPCGRAAGWPFPSGWPLVCRQISSFCWPWWAICCPCPFCCFSCERSFACSASGPGGGRRSTAWNPRPSQGAHGPKISDPGADHFGRHPPPRHGAWTGALVATIFRIPSKALPALLDRRAHRRGHRDRRLLRRDLPLGLMDPPPRIDCTV